MAERVEKVTQVTETRVGGAVLAARIITFITSALLILLALRFALVLLGANPANGFADFIYDISHPFVSPFFGLFGYDLNYGVSRFETYTLVAMAVYAIVGYGLARLVTLGQPRRDADV